MQLNIKLQVKFIFVLIILFSIGLKAAEEINLSKAVFKEEDCSRCHAIESKDYKTSVHNSPRLKVGCTECHQQIHQQPVVKKSKIAIAEHCSQCHTHQERYFTSEHGKAAKLGEPDAATCTDCHGLHAISKVDNKSQGRIFHTNACLKCHSDSEMMIRNKVRQMAPETFYSSYHGKNVRLGYPEKVAGCADCHDSHGVLKAKDINSTIHPNNLVKTCVQCHQSATALFTQYLPHSEHRDKENFPVLFWTFVAMSSLLVGTFFIFWMHSILWALRAYVETRKKARHQSFPTEPQFIDPSEHTQLIIQDGQKLYRRFKPVHIFLHLVLIISFLTLSLTGLPLRFSSTNWGKTMVDYIGGTARAGLIHRTAAFFMFVCFFIVLGLCINFLFFNKKIKGSWQERLFGPESLFPNLRDLHDIRKMIKWFMFRGPKPTFDRWTYWEKFDFLAVFWGMIVIGGSGLMLWFPEFFGTFLPGWTFNVATIIHSDEALLATGFIFTVHFFNTHMRPEKFPMDFVIFNGEISKQEMLEERKDQWDRYEKENSTDDYLVIKPSSLVWDLVFKVFGFIAVLVGLAIAAAIVYNMI